MSFEELRTWVRPGTRHNLKQTLDRLVHDRAFAHTDGARYYITQAGILEVERSKLYEMPNRPDVNSAGRRSKRFSR